MSVTPSDKTHERKLFLQLVIASIGGLLAASLTGVGLTYFLAPAWRKKKEAWVDLGPLGDIAVGNPVKLDYIQRQGDGWITVEGRSSVWVVRDGVNVTAFNPHCTHLGCAYRWDDKREQFLCPCHSGVYDKQGKVVSGPPPRPLDTYHSKIEEGRFYILPGEKTA